MKILFLLCIYINLGLTFFFNLQHNEAVHSLYESLRDKVGNHSTEDQLVATAQIDPLSLDCSPAVFTGISSSTSSPL